MKIAPVFLVAMLLFVEKEANAGYCGMRIVNGKLEKYGDCDHKQQSQVLKSLDDKLKKLKKPKTRPKSCSNVNLSDVKVKNGNSGVFDIYPESIGKEVEVYCDLETDGGNWTVFQRRMDGSEDFFRVWDDYVTGFGRKDGEFWLGLENLHQMTKNGTHELRIELGAFDGSTAYAKYGSFSIGSSAENYTLNVGWHSGTAGDSLSSSHGAEPFTTKDKDNDKLTTSNCAELYKGAWWYNSDVDCGLAILNGQYFDKVGTGGHGVYWHHWKRFEFLKFAEMKFRRVE